MEEVDLTAFGKAAATHFDKDKRPKVAWIQTADSLAVIVRIPEATEPTVDVEETSVFIRVTGADGKRYAAKLLLDGKVQMSVETWETSIRKGSVKVTLKKAKESEGEWDRLVNQPAKLTKNWLEYDWDAHNEIEEDDVEPDEKEQPDVEPLKRPRFEEPQKESESREAKQSKWAEKQAQLEKEAEEIRQKQGPVKKSMGLKFNCEQLATIMAVVVLLTALITHYLTRLALAS
eukprot:TRINITY_DN8987_c0_g1_i2.p1 TRINITY_DN8987_c0_g1~~TRINITY_DN8987_c0_g1_i2.p1  ORF type:complete len:255 (+),score=100.81 TRINITY_DN8987_c0_g1_i2:70-765(+)